MVACSHPETNCMTVGFDTNIFVYAVNRFEPARQVAALDLLHRHPNGVLLWQVSCEFIAACRKLERHGVTPEDAWDISRTS